MAEYIGELRLDNKVDITDPCYDKDVWCRMTTDCEPGIYHGYAEIEDQGEWGMRVTSISIYKDDKFVPMTEMESIGFIGVDAGLAGFFRDKPDYSDAEWHDFIHDNMCKENGEYDYNKNTYCIDYGVFSESGYGDGSYEVYANEERTAFTIEFIWEDE